MMKIFSRQPILTTDMIHHGAASRDKVKPETLRNASDRRTASVTGLLG